MCRATAGALRAISKSWPLGFPAMAARIAAASSASPTPARSTWRRSVASSWPRQVCRVPVQGQAHAVTCFAEIVAQRGDEAQPPPSRPPAHSGRAPGVERQALERPETLQFAPQALERQVLIRAVGLDLSHRHGFDQGDVAALAVRPGDQVGNLGGVVILQGHGVDLDGQARGLRSPDARQHLGHIAASRQAAEQVRLEGVERDVHPPHAGGRELGRKFRQPRAVGGKGQFVQVAGPQMAAQPADQAHHPLADQRLSTRQPQLSRPKADEGRGDAVEFLKGQHLGLRQEGHVLRHAVDAARGRTDR